jgi:hypothetical protein
MIAGTANHGYAEEVSVNAENEVAVVGATDNVGQDYDFTIVRLDGETSDCGVCGQGPPLQNGIHVSRLRMTPPRSLLALRADVLSAPFLPDHPLSAFRVLRVSVKDAFAHEHSEDWDRSTCRTAGSGFKCATQDRSRVISLKPVRGMPMFRLKARCRGWSLTPPLWGPVTASLTLDDVLVWEGITDDCRVDSKGGLNCGGS